VAIGLLCPINNVQVNPTDPQFQHLALFDLHGFMPLWF
jgi:hypothetical protein